MLIYIKNPRVDPPKYYRYEASASFVRRHDNGAFVSCGLTVGDTIGFVPEGAIEVTHEEYNHSSCLSTCTLRGARHCTY